MTSEARRERCWQHLADMHRELEARGVSCQFQDDLQPSLRICLGRENRAGDEPGESVFAAVVCGRWWFCWAWDMVICPVVPVTRAAAIIVGELGLSSGDAGRDAASLDVWRALRQARLEIFRPAAARGPGGGARSGTLLRAPASGPALRSARPGQA